MLRKTQRNRRRLDSVDEANLVNPENADMSQVTEQDHAERADDRNHHDDAEDAPDGTDVPRWMSDHLEKGHKRSCNARPGGFGPWVLGGIPLEASPRASKEHCVQTGQPGLFALRPACVGHMPAYL